MKTQNIIVTVLVTAFLALNTYLVFAEKSVIPKAQYVSEYERLSADDYKKELDKEGFISPKDLHTIYLKDDQTIDSWLVQEGETVDFGTELASLKVDHIDSKRNELESELSALQNQSSSISQTISNLEYEQSSAGGSKNDSDYYDTNDDKKVRVNLNVGIEVREDGTFAQAIAEAERDLAEVQRKTEVVESQLAEIPNESALTSPVSGYVVAIKRDSESPSIDIYSTDQTIVTYVLDNEWPNVETGAPVTIQHDSIHTPFTPKVDPNQQPEDQVEPVEPEGMEDGTSSTKGKSVASLSADGVPPSTVPYDDPKTEIDGTDAEPPAVNSNDGSNAPEENFDGTSGNPDGSVDKPDAPVSTPDSSIDSSNNDSGTENKPDTETAPTTETPNTDSTTNPDATPEATPNPDDATTNPDGTITNPDGTISNPEVNDSPEGKPALTNKEKKLAEVQERITPDYPNDISTINGVIVSVSKVPAKEDEWLEAYKALGNTQKDNPLAYYEVRVAPYDEQMNLPFGTNVNTFIQTNEANQVVSVKTNWLTDKYENNAKVWTLDNNGRAVQNIVDAPFTSLDRTVLATGVEPGMVALHNEDLDSSLEHQSVYHPLPLYLPEWDKWKTTPWQNYVRYLIKR
ncbi:MULTISPECIES: hypothetical protein [unclassified Sporosarcina]|uniref:hypothetical protein n=1 Tax=unclassified Sporosarcina TaxID=2647733 RepID=UPI000C1708F3|nr:MULTISPECIES: hypothetical protein [unclassified Sporosarcina]PID03481.1 hypothetical protein CSV66_16085 [Sporosarcina sp. P30]PID07456.1 hypothetical protein CSV65_16135 [Sporosarcina sp. P31]PID10649.1 hypothetical protein CSV64_16090 [Sporosarcina sp. P32b]